ncbi:unnamed protein product [Prunus brigantina]
MEDGNISGPSVVAELTWSHDVQDDHALMMVSLSRHLILDMEKSVTQLVDLTKSIKEDHRQDKLEEMEKSLTQLVEDLCLILASSANPSQPETTTIRNSTVHEAVNPYLRLVHAWLIHAKREKRRWRENSEEILGGGIGLSLCFLNLELSFGNKEGVSCDGWNSWVDKESMEKRVMRRIFCVVESDHYRDQHAMEGENACPICLSSLYSLLHAHGVGACINDLSYMSLFSVQHAHGGGACITDLFLFYILQDSSATPTYLYSYRRIRLKVKMPPPLSRRVDIYLTWGLGCCIVQPFLSPNHLSQMDLCFLPIYEKIYYISFLSMILMRRLGCQCLLFHFSMAII